LTRFNVPPIVGEREHREVRAAHSPLSRGRARGATARAGAGGSQKGACDATQGAPRAEERGVPAARATRLSSPGTEEYSSSDEEEEEEEVRGQTLTDRWEPIPPSPEPAPVAGAASPGAGVEAPAAMQSTTGAARATGAPVCAPEVRTADAPTHGAGSSRAGEAARGEAATVLAAPASSAGTSRKRKRAFSSSR
jgi:hypothetical protein